MKHIRTNTLDSTPTSHDPNLLKKVIAKNGEIPHITQIATITLAPGDRVEPHTHPDMTEVFYCLSGSFQALINNAPITSQAGDTLIVEPGDTHQLSNDSKNPVTLFYFGIVS